MWILFFLLSFLEFVSGADWCYQSQVSCNHSCAGPDRWRRIFPRCGSTSQSPVNVVTRKALSDSRLTPLNFLGYRAAFHGNLSNNGHTAQLDLPAGMRVEGGHLLGTYKAVQLHFHWGRDGGPGSEHTIDGERYPMEMHIVHIKDQYATLSQAVRDPTGVAVLAFFIEVIGFPYYTMISTLVMFFNQWNRWQQFQESNTVNKKFEPLIKALKRIPQPSNKTTVAGISLQMFLPPHADLSQYFRYEGSLTTPDCAQAVVWTLFERLVPLSGRQLSAFSQLAFSSGGPMVNTFRDVQPLNGRPVFRSGGPATTRLRPALLVAAALILYSV